MNRLVIVLLSFFVLGAVNVYAEDAKPAGEISYEEKMAEMAKYSQPTENHKRLDVLVGKWNHTVTMWMDPKAEPKVSQGSNENKWILDGKFVYQEAKDRVAAACPWSLPPGYTTDIIRHNLTLQLRVALSSHAC